MMDTDHIQLSRMRFSNLRGKAECLCFLARKDLSFLARNDKLFLARNDKLFLARNDKLFLARNDKLFLARNDLLFLVFKVNQPIIEIRLST